MKKLLIIGIIFLLSGCDVFHEDPHMRESERIAVMQKMKVDTTLMAVELDEKVYLVRGDKVEKMVPKEDSTPILCLLLGLVIGGFVVGAICER